MMKTRSVGFATHPPGFFMFKTMPKSTLAKQGIPFTQTPNELINDFGLSDLAVRTYIFMSSKPDGWNFTVRSMAKQMGKSDRTLGNAVRELKSAGWLSYAKKNDGHGVYTLHCSPSGNICNVQNPHPAENAGSKIRTLQDLPHISNTDSNSNTDLNSNTDKINEPIGSLTKGREDHFEECSKRFFKDVTKADAEKFTPEQMQYWKTAAAFYKVFAQNLKSRGVPTINLEKARFKPFVDPIRLMYERDNLTREHMVKLYDFLQVDDFWATNVQSTTKLRKQFTQLLMKAYKNERQGTNTADSREPIYSESFINSIIADLNGGHGNKSA